MPVRLINRVIAFGDSLSDRGKMYKRLLLGIIPLGKLSGLSGKSPDGRFTNQYTWLDHWATMLSESKYIKSEEAKGHSPIDIMERLLTHKYTQKSFRDSFRLENDEHVRNFGEEFLNTYCEGGATAAKWSDDFTWSIPLNATRKIVTNLENERKIFLAEEEAKKVSQEEKDATLISIFIGANDLITVNDPSKLSADEQDAVIDKAVAAQMEHIQALINEGYKNYALTNLPNLGLTPRFQNNGWADIGEQITNKYNEKLNKEYKKLQEQNQNKKDLQFSFYDVHQIFNEIYNHPEKYGFDRSKLTNYFKDSEEFKQNFRHSGGYLFWDEVHPTSKMHLLIQRMISEQMDFKPLYKSYLGKEENVPNVDLNFAVIKVENSDDLAKIEDQVNLHQEQIKFVKFEGKWFCYRHQDGVVANHYIDRQHYPTLDILLNNNNHFTDNEENQLMTLALRNHWKRGIYLYKNIFNEIKAEVIHKPFVPCSVSIGKQVEQNNSYSLVFSEKTNYWSLSYLAYNKGHRIDVDLKRIPELFEFLKGKNKIDKKDEKNVHDWIESYYKKTCKEKINLTQLLAKNANPDVQADLENLFKNPEGPINPSIETLDFIQSKCIGFHPDENKYVIEPAVVGFHLQFKDKGPSPEDKEMVQARRGTSVLVYYKKNNKNTNELYIGYCGKQGFKEMKLDKFAREELENMITPPYTHPQRNYTTLARPSPFNYNEKKDKEAEGPADTPFEILDNLIKRNHGYSFDEASMIFEFAKAYKERWKEQKFAAVFGSFFMRSRIEPYNTDLVGIFRHALKNSGERSREVLIDLGWIDTNNELRTPFNQMGVVKTAYDKVMPEKNADALIAYLHNHR